MENKRVSIKDVARMSGVSVTTVSRVLNKTGRFSEETARKVREVVERTGYHPSTIAAGLRVGQTRTIGIVVPDITNDFFASITLAVQNTLMEETYGTFICNTNERPEVQAKQMDMLRSSRVAGIIFISGEDISDEEMTDGIPKVFVDRIPWNADAKDAVSIRTDSFLGGQLATGELLDKGCRRIAAIFDGRGLSTQVARYSGYTRAYQERGLEAPRDLYYPASEVTFQGGYETTKELIRSNKQFDGIFCYSDQLAYGAIRALQEAGIEIPGQVRVVGYDNGKASMYCNPPLTTIAQPVSQMGTLAAQLILKLCKGQKLEQVRYNLPVELIVRATT